MSDHTKSDPKRLRYKPDFVRDRVAELIRLSKTIVQFKKEKSSLLEGEYYDTLLTKITEYELGFNGIVGERDRDKLYQVYYDLFVRMFFQYQKDIIDGIDLEGRLIDQWILGKKSNNNKCGISNHIKLALGSNKGKPIGIELPLSEIYGCAHLVYHKYKNNQQYQKQSRMAVFYIWCLYRIFTGFQWSSAETIKRLNILEKHIKINILGLRDESKTNDFKTQVSSIIKQLPSIAKMISTTFAGDGQSGFGKNVEKASDTAQKLMDNPKTTDLLFEVFDEIKGVTDGNGGLNLEKVMGGLMAKANDTDFTDRFKATVQESTGRSVEELIKDPLGKKEDDNSNKLENAKSDNSNLLENAKSKNAKSENAKLENVKSENAKSENAKSENVKSKNAKSENAKSNEMENTKDQTTNTNNDK